MPAGCFALFFVMLFFIFFPLFLANIAITAISRLGLSPNTAPLILLGIVIGSVINIPVKKIEHNNPVEVCYSPMYGIRRLFPQLVRRCDYTLIAVNVGGCVIPVALALYQVMRMIGLGFGAIIMTAIAISLNIYVCYRTSKPVEGVGIAMMPIIPGAIAALSALVLMPSHAPQLAFAAGVLGPLIGADILHLNEISQSPTGMASIGGAGTFDGIVLTGLIAVLLA